MSDGLSWDNAQEGYYSSGEYEVILIDWDDEPDEWEATYKGMLFAMCDTAESAKAACAFHSEESALLERSAMKWETGEGYHRAAYRSGRYLLVYLQRHSGEWVWVAHYKAMRFFLGTHLHDAIRACEDHKRDLETAKTGDRAGHEARHQADQGT